MRPNDTNADQTERRKWRGETGKTSLRSEILEDFRAHSTAAGSVAETLDEGRSRRGARLRGCGSRQASA